MTGKELTVIEYRERMLIVLDYIENNLDKKIELSELASVSNFSVYHFHRIFKAYLGEPTATYVKRIRMENAATLLMHTTEPVNEIAYRMGYDVPSSFTKAFSKHWGMSPVEFRTERKTLKFEQDMLNINHQIMEMKIKPKIKEVKEKKVIFKRMQGAYAQSAEKAWDEICTFMKKKKLFGFSTEFIGVSHDDPDVTEESNIRYDACVTIRKTVEPEGDIGVKTIAGGKYAIFRHNGPYENFSETYSYIYRQWLPESGEALRDDPCYELYINSPDKAKPEKLKTDIYIPLQ